MADAGVVTFRCPFCGGPSHPAVGSQLGPRTVVCFRCNVEAWRWVLQHVNGKGLRRGLAFYDHVGGPR